MTRRKTATTVAALLGGAAMLVGAVASAATVRHVRPAGLVVDAERAAGTAAVEAYAAEAAALGIAWPKTMQLRASARAALSRAGAALVEVHGRIDGVPTALPIAKALVGEGGRVQWMSFVELAGTSSVGFAPAIDANTAIARVATSGRAGAGWADDAQLVVVPRSGRGVLAWRVDPPLDLSVPADPVFWVDAHSGHVVQAYDRVRFAQVEAFRTNPIDHPNPELFELNAIDPLSGFLEGPFFRARNCLQMTPGATCNPSPTVTADVDGNFFVALPDIMHPEDNVALEDAYAEVSAYFHADRFHAFLQSLGYEGIPCVVDGVGATLTANFRTADVDGQPGYFPNAFYTGSCEDTVVLGQGPETDFGYDGDVIYHEIGHGMVEKQVGPDSYLGGLRMRADAVVTDAGAINEGLADFFSSAFTGDPEVGEYAGIARDNSNDFTCPSGMTGEIHYDSEPWAAALWELHQLHGDPFYLAVLDATSMLASDATFEEAASALEAATEVALGPQAADDVHAVMTERNLVDCPRHVDADTLEREIWLFPSAWDENFTPVRPPPFQIAFEGPPGAKGVRLSFGEQMPAPDEYTSHILLLVKRGAPIEYTYEDNGGLLVTVDADSTEQYDLEDGAVQVPIAEGERVFGALVILTGDTLIRLLDPMVEYEVEPVQGDTGTTTAAEDTTTGEPHTSTTGVDSTTGTDGTTTDPGVSTSDGGCGCRHRARPIGSVGLFVLVAACRRRRL